MKKLLIFSLSVFSVASFAKSTFDGCGLGWEVMDKKTVVGTTVRATTNYVVSPTFGMTSGTMGCDKFEGLATNEIANAQYVASNYDMIRTELALGSGEYLTGAMDSFSACGEEKLLPYVKENFEQVVTSAKDGIELYKNLKAASNQACS